MAAQPDYTGLPDWVRVGATVDYISWADTSSWRSVATATITKVLKTEVVFTYTYRGTEITEKTYRDTLARKRRGYGGGGQLHPVGTPEAHDLRAVARARAAVKRVEGLLGERVGNIRTKGDAEPVKKLETAADALDMLRAQIGVLEAARRKILDGHYDFGLQATRDDTKGT
jgi:hypothetical protein